MIRFLSPGFAWALAAPAVILVLYLLRRRFLPRQVPAVFLWRRTARDYAANRPFRRLMKNLLLPLQMLAVLALALALMRPALPGGTAGHTVLIFDVSGSMQTETAGKTRLALAKERALRIIAGMPAEEKITVLTAGDEPERLALSADREEAATAVASVTCGRGGADLDGALILADALSREAEGGARVIVFSDSFRRQDANLRSGTIALSILNSGTGTENRAVYSLTAEPGTAYARAANYGEECTAVLICEADGVLCGAQEIRIPAGGTEGVRFDLPEGAERVRVSLREADSLAADNAAETVVRRPKEYRAAVTGDSVFLESALRVRPDLTVLRTEPEALASTEADLYILGSSPVIMTRKLPEGGYDPGAASFGGFSWAEEEKEAGGSPAAELFPGPLTGGLTMKNVYFRAYRPISGGRTAMTLDGDPVIAYGDDTVVLGFDLHGTNLPLKYDFPVLIQNVTDLLLPEEVPAEETVIGLMPAEESDTRMMAPDDEAEGGRAENEQGRELTGILLVLFLLLMIAEMGVSRYVG